MGDLTHTTELLEFSDVLAELRSSDKSTVRGARILVVDDEPAIQRAVRRVLKSLGVIVDVAAGAFEAIEKLDREVYDLIISDVHMQGGNGIELLEHLRESDEETPIIMISGAPTVESAIAAVNYKAYHYLTKPFSFDELRNLSEAAILEARAEQRQSTLNVTLNRRKSRDEEQFDSAMSSIWVAKQPIVNKRRNPVGFEVLLRTEEKALKEPENFWFCAVSLGKEHELSLHIRRYVVELMHEHPHHFFFYNIHESELRNGVFLAPKNVLHPYAKRVVLEISDKKGMESATLARTVASLRQLGYRFAIDNFGTGSSSMDLIFQIKPDYVKLDHTLIEDIHKNEAHYKRVKRLLKVCRDINIDVIAERVETPSDFDTLKEIGVEIFQGFLFGHPVA